MIMKLQVTVGAFLAHSLLAVTWGHIAHQQKEEHINNTSTPYVNPPSSPELRLKLIDERTPVSLLEVDNYFDCFPFEESLSPDQHVTLTTLATLYYPMKKDIPLYGLSLTVESREYVCEDPWIGMNTVKMLGRSLVPLDHADPKFLERVIDNALASNWDTARFWPGMTEGERRPEVDCNYASTTYKTQLYAVVERVKITTSMNWRLLQPTKVDSCEVGRNSSCDLSRYSRLYFSSGYMPHGCEVSVLAQIAGVLSTSKNQSTEIRFHSESEEFELSLHRPSESHSFQEECRTSDSIIFSSTEGHLVAFSTREGVPDIDRLLELARPRTKRDLTTIRGPLPSNITIPLERPPRLHSIVTSSSGRSKRDNNNDYPSHQRLDYLENKIAWGLSNFEYYQGQIAQTTAEELLRTRYTQCLMKNSLLEMAALLKNPTMYARLRLDDPGILIVSRDPDTLRVLVGRPIPSVRIPGPPFSWCNKTLAVEFREGEGQSWFSGWLAADTGLILASSFSGSQCITKSAPSTFLIPSYDQGMWDLFSQRYAHEPQNRIKRNGMRYSVVNLPVDSSMSAWEYHERGVEFTAEYSPEDSWSALKRLIAGGYSPMVAWVPNVLKLVVGGILILLSFRVFSIIAWFCPSPSQSPSYSRGKLLS